MGNVFVREFICLSISCILRHFRKDMGHCGRPFGLVVVLAGLTVCWISMLSGRIVRHWHTPE
jgi:hypothetical protein